MSDVPAKPLLAPPGAGLPRLETAIARLIFRAGHMRTDRAGRSKLLKMEKETVLRLVAACDPERASRRVLIKRLRGMEDSSRYWSVYMTLDHLRIVNLGCAEAIRQLGKGQVPARAANTAAVKPGPQAGPESIEAFERSCAFVETCATAVKDPEHTPCYAHPWFGPLNAAAWHFLTGFHMKLHHRQIECILDKMRR